MISFRIVVHSSSLLPEEVSSLCTLSSEACPNCWCSFNIFFMFSVTMRISSSFWMSLPSGALSSLMFKGCLNMMPFSFSMSKTAPALFSKVLLKSNGISAWTTSVSIWHLVCAITVGIFTFLVEWTNSPSPNLNGLALFMFYVTIFSTSSCVSWLT